MKITKNLNKKTTLLIVLLLSLLPLIILLVRSNSNPYLIGQIPYETLKISNQISQKEYFIDTFFNRPLMPTPYHFLVSLISPFQTSAIIITLLFTILSFFLFYLILDKLKIKQNIILLTLLIFSFSPIYSNIFLIPNSNSLALFLNLFLFFILINSKKNILVFFISLILILFSPIHFIFSLIIILAFTLHKKQFKFYIPIIFLLIIISSIYYLPLYQKFGFPISPYLFTHYLKQLISDLGGSLSFGVFTILLAIIGSITLWEKNKQLLRPLYIIVLSLFILTFFTPITNIYLNLFLSIFAAYAFYKIIRFKFTFDIIKQLTILSIICGLLFSTISYSTRLIDSEPNSDIIQPLLWLKENTPEDSIILSHYSRGNWIEYFAERKPVLNSNFNHISNLNAILNETNEIFYSRNLINTKSLLTKHKISHIFIDNTMKTNLVWQKPNQGLLSIISNKETFEKIYSDENVEIYKLIN